MDNNALDISHTILAKSAQLNADDLIAGPVTVRIASVNLTDTEQPVAIHLDGHQPFMPCKTMRRVLVAGWGADAGKWVGRYLSIFRDPDVKWAGKAIGGIRIAAMSDIKGSMTLTLAETKGGKKLEYKIAVLARPAAEVMDFDTFNGWLKHAVKVGGWTRDQVVALLGCAADEVKPADRRDIVARLKSPPETQGGES